MATTYLTRSKSSPTSDKKGTISFWFKRSKITAEQVIIVSGSGSIDSNIYLNGSTDKLHVYDYQSGAFSFQYITTRVFRDTSAWTHLTVEIDTTLATASDRVKIYINGVRETAFDTSTAPSQDATPLFFTSANPFYIGAYRGSSSYFDGLLSHFHYTDGYAYGASTFGSTDTNGQWKIKADPSITMGTNGFTILKDGNTITDQSSNSNNFTLGGGTLTNTEDCPSNVFATLNRLTRHGQNTNNMGDMLENGNTVFYTPSSTDSMKGLAMSTFGITSGKYYCEMKLKAGIRLQVGICNQNVFKSTSVPYDVNNQSYIGYTPNGGNIKYDGDSTYATGISSTTDDILGFALDMDNNHFYIHKNGTYFDSGDPTSGSSGTGSIIGNITSGSSYFNHGEMFFFASDFSTSGYARAQFNFGNGFFGTTAISSEGSNASGIGKFEYDVPTGYTALSTKGLNE